MANEESYAAAGTGVSWTAYEFVAGRRERDEFRRSVFGGGKPGFGKCDKVRVVVRQDVVEVK